MKTLETDNKLADYANQVVTAKTKKIAARVYICKFNKGQNIMRKKSGEEISQSISELGGRDFRKMSMIENLP